MRTSPALVGALAATLFSALSAPASACGGFFCNATNPVPIYQAGERVLFARSGGKTIMHVEVQYQGPPTSFGWLLPLSGLPLGDDGQPLPLDKALKLSHATIFSTLQSVTAPSFSVQNSFAPGGGCDAFGFPGGGPQDASASASDTTGASYEPPPVAVLQEAAVGPYAAQIIQATSADALFAWLNENGYIQDEKARPLLEEYVAKKYVFLGLRLQNGKSTGDLRPVALTLPEDAPCVPLRLTSIAATPEMPILVFLLGEGRAVPKNNFHAVINPKALGWPGAPNYLNVISEAVDGVKGHAFVTEFAGAASVFNRAFWPGIDPRTASLAAAKTLLEVLNAYAAAGMPQDETYNAIVRSHVKLPAGLKGYPYGNCYMSAYPPRDPYSDTDGGSPYGCPPNDDHVTTDAEFYNYLRWWLTIGGVAQDEVAPALRDQLIAEVFDPLQAVQALFDASKTLTRFLTLLDPEQMDRDPIFSFNPDLPDVSNQHVLLTTIHQPTCEKGWIEALYEDGTVHVTECNGVCSSFPSIPAVDGEPALKTAEVLDETGKPVPVSPTDYATVDGYLSVSVAGSPTIPAGVVVTPPEEKPPVTGNDLGHTIYADVVDISTPAVTSDSSGGCTQAASGTSGALWALLVGLTLVATRRMRRA